jgi:hypothetical protein
MDYKVAPRLCRFKLGRHNVQVYWTAGWVWCRRDGPHDIAGVTARAWFVGRFCIACLSMP